MGKRRKQPDLIRSKESNEITEDENVTLSKKSKNSCNIKTIDKIKSSDPEFYKFLQEEDRDLLNFDIEDDSDVESDIHELPDKLEEATESSNDELSEGEGENIQDIIIKNKQLILKPSGMLKFIEELNTVPVSSKSKVILNIIAAVKAVLYHFTSDKEVISKFVVNDSETVKCIMDNCILYIPCTFENILNFKQKKSTNLPSSSKKWNNYKSLIKSYILSILQLVSNTANSEVQLSLIKHLSNLVPYISSMPKTSKLTIKKMITIWSSGEDSCRLASVLVLAKMTVADSRLVDPILKLMYSGYVSNSKFVSVNSLPNINMMRRSLVELLAINQEKAYNYAFVYIRQLAILLRNAITIKKKESYESVYNWQFVQSLSLWTSLLSRVHPSAILKPLIFPLTQLIIGTISLQATPKYFPLRFHLVHLLNELSLATETFIPVLPYIQETLDIVDFNSKNQSLSAKSFIWSIMLKLSKSQLKERSFKDGIVEETINLIMEHVNIHASSISFPELVMPLLLHLKKLNKSVKVANYTRKFKAVIEKVEENSKFIVNRRRKSCINLRKSDDVKDWEIKCKEEGTPFGLFYNGWKKIREKELALKISSNVILHGENNNENKSNKKSEKLRKASLKERHDLKELFYDNDDNISDFNDDELTQLAQSASDDSVEEFDDGKEIEIRSRKKNVTKKQVKTKIKSFNNSDNSDEDDIVEEFSFSDDSE